MDNHTFKSIDLFTYIFVVLYFSTSFFHVGTRSTRNNQRIYKKPVEKLSVFSSQSNKPFFGWK